MNLITDYRTAIHDVTDDRPSAAYVPVCLAAGRRRRRVRRNLVAGGTLTAVAIATLSVAALQRPEHRVAVDGFATSPSYQDFVPGTDVDGTLQATVGAHLSGLAAADKVSPSDWNRLVDGYALPDGQAMNATDWQAWYSPSGHDEVMVEMSKSVPGWPTDPQCSEIVPSEGAPPCSVTSLPDGGQVARYGTYAPEEEMPNQLHPYSFTTLRTNAGGSYVLVRELVAADSWAQATALRSITDDQARALADDPAMTFPDPVVVPADPKGP